MISVKGAPALYVMGGKMTRKLKTILLVQLLLLCLLSLSLAQSNDCATSDIHTFNVVDTTLQPNVIVNTYQACSCFVTQVVPDTITCGQQPSPTPTPTPTPTPSPMPSPTPSPTPTPTPSPTPTLTTLTFDSPVPQNPLNGIYGGINWGTNQWAWEGAFLGFSTRNVFFNTPTGQSRSFSFVSPHILTAMDLLTDLNGTLTITTDAGETFTVVVNTGPPKVGVKTNFIKPATKVTFTFVTSDGAGWHVDFDNIVYQ